MRNNDSMLNKSEFDVKDKDIAEFVAFINNKTISQDENKLHLTNSKDIEKQIKELFKNKKYIEANELLETSKETIDRKRYWNSLISTRTYSYRYSLIPYLKLINQAIIQKSNVSTIVKKDMGNTIKTFLKEEKKIGKEKKRISTIIEKWEKEFKEKEWSKYELFDFDFDTKEYNTIGSYQYACIKTLIYFIKNELKRTGLTHEEINEFISFFELEDAFLITSCHIINDKEPKLVIVISISSTVESLHGYTKEEEIPYGNKIWKNHENTALDIEIQGEDAYFYYELKKTLPLNKILTLSKEELEGGKLKNLLFFNDYPKDIEEPKDFEKIKKILPIMTRYKLEEKIADEITQLLIRCSNVITFSSPKIIPIAYRTFTGKKR